MGDLQIAPDLQLPTDAVTQTFAIFGKRGSGKSNTAVVLAEEMHRSGAPFVVLDPISAWWGLKSSFDGKGPGLPVYVFGGPHGDLPLQPDKGELMAQVFIRHRQSMILDMKGWTGGERAKFVTDFARWLLGHNDRVPAHVFLEEADAFVPQRPFKGEEQMLGAIDRLVRWGRQEGLGATLVTQRSAKVNKDVTTQAETLIAHRTTGPQDRDAIREWIKYHAGDQEAEVLSTLPTLPDGTAWVWSPEWLGILRKVAVRRRSTYDSAATPKMGQKRVEPKALAAVDLDQLREQLATTIEQAKANDPKELQRQVRELQRALQTEMAKSPLALQEVQIREVEKVVERSVLNEEDHRLIDELIQQLEAVATLAGPMRDLLVSRLSAIDNAPAPRPAPVIPAAAMGAFPGAQSGPDRARTPAPHVNGAPSIGKGERTVLGVLRQYPAGRTYNELAFLAGYSAKASTLGVILAKLRQLGYVAHGNQPVILTPEGTEAAGGTEAMPTGQALLSHWLNHPRMGKGERDVLQVLIETFPSDLSHVELCERAGYSPTASTMGVILSKLRKLGLVEKGARRLAPEFAEAIR